MIDIRQIKRKRKVIQNIIDITQAIETVSAIRMKKSQEIALGARPFAKSCLEILAILSQNFPQASILFEKEIKKEKPCLIIIASDKGLCGPFNGNVFRKTEEFLRKEDKKMKLITIGKMGFSFFSKRGFEILASFQNFSDVILPEEIEPILNKIFELYQKGEFNLCWAIYTNFINTFNQEVVLRKILPVEKESLEAIVQGILPPQKQILEKEEIFSNFEYLFEPDPLTIFENLIPFLFKIQIFHIILESNASEHSARMVAMKNAREHAQDFLKEIVKFYNKVRQEIITKEIIEIITAKETIV